MPAYVSSLKCLDVSPDGRRLVAVGRDPASAVKVWDARTGQELLNLGGHTQRVGSVAFSPDGQRLASAAWGLELPEPEVLIWDAQTGRQTQRLRGHTRGVQCVAFSPDGRRLAWGGTDATVKVWDEAGDAVQTLRGHTGWVNRVAFSPDGKQIASASADGTVKIWEAPPVAESPGRKARDQDP